MTEQLRPDGSLRHLLTLQGLPKALLERLLERAQSLVRPLGADSVTVRFTVAVVSGLDIAGVEIDTSGSGSSSMIVSVIDGNAPISAFVGSYSTQPPPGR